MYGILEESRRGEIPLQPRKPRWHAHLLRQKSWNTAERLVKTFKRETQRRKVFIRKAKICEEKLAFVVTAFNKLLADEYFLTLLRAESLATMPQYLWAKLDRKSKEVV